jgi:hypothetical protein
MNLSVQAVVKLARYLNDGLQDFKSQDDELLEKMECLMPQPSDAQSVVHPKTPSRMLRAIFVLQDRAILQKRLARKLFKTERAALEFEKSLDICL